GGGNVSSSMGTQLTGNMRFAFNVSLRMFTMSIVIQRRVKDLQLGVESYQKRLNLTKPDMYQLDLKRREAYTAYSNPRGFIYQNKDKKNRLMRIDELHKFNDGTLNDVRNALDDRLKGIRMHEIVTHWFTLIVLSALRRSNNENMLSLVISILRLILTDLQVTPTKPGGMTKPYSSHYFIANCFIAGNIKGEWRYLFPAEPQFITTCSYPTIKTSATLMYSNGKVSACKSSITKAQDGGDHLMMNRDYAWLMISRHS
nr:hypothetical protein [Tanacetum cinerariifolium]